MTAGSAGRGTSRSKGRTVVELVIALAIGLAVLVGVADSYLSSYGAARVAQQVGSAEHTARLALSAIAESVKPAGYGEIVGSDAVATQQTLFDGPALRGCTAGRFADPFNASAPDLSCIGPAPGDALLVRYQGRYALVPMEATHLAETALPDCLGASNPAQDATLSAAGARAGAGLARRLVQSAFQLDGSGTTLRCHGNGNPGRPAPIANDVLAFRVLYRFDDAGFALAAGRRASPAPVGGTLRDAAWINAAAAGAPTDPWRHVVAVVVCLTVATREAGTTLRRATDAAAHCPQATDPAPAGSEETPPSGDGRLRRTFVEIFTVRAQATAAPSIAPTAG